MTVESTSNKDVYTGNGSATSFDYNNKIYAKSDLEVTHVDNAPDPSVSTLLVEGVDYSINGDWDSGEVCTITYPLSGSALPSTEQLVLRGIVPETQNTNIKNQGGFNAETHERVFDRTMRVIQNLLEQAGRTIKLPIQFSADVETPNPLANAVLAWNAAGNGFQNGPLLSTILSGITANIKVEEFVDGVDYTSGTDAQLTLTDNPQSENNMLVFFGGSHKLHSGYTYNNITKKISFSSVIPTGVPKIEVIIWQPIAIGEPSDGTVTTAKIVNLNVTTAKIALLAITEALIAAGAVTTTKIADSAVTLKKLNGTVITTAGTAAAYTLTTGLASFETDRIYEVDFHTLCDGDATINPDGAGAIDLVYRSGVKIDNGALDGIHHIKYDGTNAIVIDPLGGELLYKEDIVVAKQNVDITGLNLDKHRKYILEIQHSADGSTDSLINLYANADYTATNYWRHHSLFTTTGVHARTNDAQIASTLANQRAVVTAEISYNGVQWFHVESKSNRQIGSSSDAVEYKVNSASDLGANLTQLRIAGDHATALNAGTKIRLYRGSR